MVCSGLTRTSRGMTLTYHPRPRARPGKQQPIVLRCRGCCNSSRAGRPPPLGPPCLRCICPTIHRHCLSDSTRVSNPQRPVTHEWACSICETIECDGKPNGPVWVQLKLGVHIAPIAGVVCHHVREARGGIPVHMRSGACCTASLPCASCIRAVSGACSP